MAIQENQYGACAVSSVGTGSGFCELDTFGDLLGQGLLNDGVKILKSLSTSLGDEMIKLIKARKLHQFVDMFDFSDDTPENEINTSPLGLMQNVRDGKPYYSMIFTKNSYFHKKAWAFKSVGKYQSLLYFTNGVLFFNTTDDLAIQGAKVQMIDVNTKKFKKGTDLESTTMKVQFKDSEQFNKMYTFKTWNELGINLTEVDGVIDTVISVTGANAGTTFSVEVKNLYNQQEKFNSLDDTSNWRLGGVQDSVTTISGVVYNATTDKLDFTVSPALVSGDTIQPTLVDNTYLVAEDTDGNLFAGKSELITIS